MTYIAIFNVPDDAKPNRYSKPWASFLLPNGYYQVKEAVLKPIPKRIPEAFEDPRAEGWNACIDKMMEDTNVPE